MFRPAPEIEALVCLLVSCFLFEFALQSSAGAQSLDSAISVDTACFKCCPVCSGKQYLLNSIFSSSSDQKAGTMRALEEQSWNPLIYRERERGREREVL